MLVQILKNRIREARREQIAFNTAISITEVEADHFKVHKNSYTNQIFFSGSWGADLSPIHVQM